MYDLCFFIGPLVNVVCSQEKIGACHKFSRITDTTMCHLRTNLFLQAMFLIDLILLSSYALTLELQCSGLGIFSNVSAKNKPIFQFTTRPIVLKCNMLYTNKHPNIAQV